LLAFPPGVAGVHDFIHPVGTEQAFQNSVLLPARANDVQFEVPGQDRQGTDVPVLQGPVIVFRLSQLHQVAESPGNDVLAVLQETVVARK
jgi:hypothetical protein